MQELRDGLLHFIRLCLALKLIAVGYVITVVGVTLALSCPVFAMQEGQPVLFVWALVSALSAYLGWRLIRFAFSLFN